MGISSNHHPLHGVDQRLRLGDVVCRSALETPKCSQDGGVVVVIKYMISRMCFFSKQGTAMPAELV